MANVLSTTTFAPTSLAASTTARTSTMLSSGFVGVSIQTMATFPSRWARSVSASESCAGVRYVKAYPFGS